MRTFLGVKVHVVPLLNERMEGYVFSISRGLKSSYCPEYVDTGNLQDNLKGVKKQEVCF